jgi:LysM repeat protein
MLSRFVSVHSRHVLRLSVVAAIATGAVGCSSDVIRLSQNSPEAGSDQGAVVPIPAERPLPAPATGEVTGAIGNTGTPSGPGKRGDVVIVLKDGDTIDTVARKYGVTVHAIRKANAMTGSTTVVPGQHLVIPRHRHAVTPKESKSAKLGQTP